MCSPRDSAQGVLSNGHLAQAPVADLDELAAVGVHADAVLQPHVRRTVRGFAEMLVAFMDCSGCVQVVAWSLR